MEGGQRSALVPAAWLDAARQALSQGGTRTGRDVIDQLVPLLSDWDLMYFRQKIADRSLGSSSFAKFTSLPLDIIYYLLPFLTIKEFFAMRLVSREWNRILTQPELLCFLCRKYFPGVIPRGGANLDNIENTFIRNARLYSRKSPGTCGKMFIPWDIEAHNAIPNIALTIRTNPNSEIGPRGKYMRNPIYDSFYADGKLVLFAHKNFLLVDDLTMGTRTRIPVTNEMRNTRRVLKLEAVTGRIIVMSSVPGPSLESMLSPTSIPSAKHRTLHVFHLERKTWVDLHLPALLDECFAYDEKFIVTLHSKVVLLWTPRTGLVNISLNHPEYHAVPEGSENLYPFVAGAMFHPFNPKIFFLVWAYSYNGVKVSQNLFTTVVVKYTYEGSNNWVPKDHFRHSVNHPLPDPKPANHCFGGHAEPLGACYSRRVTKSNSNGMFLLGLYFLVNFHAEHPNEAMCDCVRASWDKDCVRALNFNVETESFYENRYYGFKSTWAVNIRTILRKGRRTSDQGTFDHIQVWNGEMYNLYLKVFDTGMSPVIQSLRGLNEDSLPLAMLSGDSDEVFFDHMSNQRALTEGPYQICVDEEFLLLIGRHGYAMWRWDKRQIDNGTEWLSSNECILPNMRYFDMSCEADHQMELNPPYADSRSDSYDRMMILHHLPTDSDITPDFE